MIYERFHIFRNVRLTTNFHLLLDKIMISFYIVLFIIKVSKKAIFTTPYVAIYYNIIFIPWYTQEWRLSSKLTKFTRIITVIDRDPGPGPGYGRDSCFFPGPGPGKFIFKIPAPAPAPARVSQSRPRPRLFYQLLPGFCRDFSCFLPQSKPMNF